MCGILSCCIDINSNFSLQEFKKNLVVTDFRGPDNSSVSKIDSSNKKIYFGHNRLSILEISSAGNQPMQSSSKRFSITFNGEIYNHLELRKNYLFGHRFRGSSDTETLLELIDLLGLDDAINLLYGMFAFVLYDHQRDEISVVRDIAGEKPLYLMTSNQSIAFSSDISNFEGMPGFKKNINFDAIKFLLSYCYIPTPMSIFNGIFKLPSSKIITVNLNTYNFQKYDSFRSFTDNNSVKEKEFFSIQKLYEEEKKILDFDENLNLLETTLSNAVRKQLISDVPLGAFLSGGIDSSLICALAQEHTSKLKTFNIGFEFLEFDESQYALDVAKSLGTDHSSYVCTKEDAINIIKDLPKAYSEPFADSSQIPTMLISKIASKEVTTVLTGDSGDELFGGYNRYSFTNRYWRYLQVLPNFVKTLSGKTMNALPAKFIENTLFKFFNINVSGNLDDRITQLSNKLMTSNDEEAFYRSFLKGWDLGEIFISQDLHTDEAIPLNDDFKKLDMFNLTEKMMVFDFMNYMTDDILCKVDRASMYSSLETRVPFLDKDVISLAASTPVKNKIIGLENKVILKNILAKFLPDNLINRPKMGFGIPVQEWIRFDLNEWAEDHLSIAQNQKHSIFDQEKIDMVWSQHKSGKANQITRLWPIIQFNQWYNHHIDS